MHFRQEFTSDQKFNIPIDDFQVVMVMNNIPLYMMQKFTVGSTDSRYFPMKMEMSVNNSGTLQLLTAGWL